MKSCSPKMTVVAVLLALAGCTSLKSETDATPGDNAGRDAMSGSAADAGGAGQSKPDSVGGVGGGAGRGGAGGAGAGGTGGAGAGGSGGVGRGGTGGAGGVSDAGRSGAGGTGGAGRGGTGGAGGVSDAGRSGVGGAAGQSSADCMKSNYICDDFRSGDYQTPANGKNWSRDKDAPAFANDALKIEQTEKGPALHIHQEMGEQYGPIDVNLRALQEKTPTSATASFDFKHSGSPRGVYPFGFQCGAQFFGVNLDLEDRRMHFGPDASPPDATSELFAEDFFRAWRHLELTWDLKGGAFWINGDLTLPRVEINHAITALGSDEICFFRIMYYYSSNVSSPVDMYFANIVVHADVD